MLLGTRTPLVHPAEEPDGHNGRTEQSAFLFIAKNDNWLLTAAGGRGVAQASWSGSREQVGRTMENWIGMGRHQ